MVLDALSRFLGPLSTRLEPIVTVAADGGFGGMSTSANPDIAPIFCRFRAQKPKLKGNFFETMARPSMRKREAGL
jgi:hypothetical protein